MYLFQNAYETAGESVDSLRSACSNAKATIRNNGSGISVQQRKEYLVGLSLFTDDMKNAGQ